MGRDLSLSLSNPFILQHFQGWGNSDYWQSLFFINGGHEELVVKVMLDCWDGEKGQREVPCGAIGEGRASPAGSTGQH